MNGNKQQSSSGGVGAGWSLHGEVANLAGEEIGKAFLAQVPHVSLRETKHTTFDRKEVHEEHDEDATIVATAWAKVKFK